MMKRFIFLLSLSLNLSFSLKAALVDKMFLELKNLKFVEVDPWVEKHRVQPLNSDELKKKLLEKSIKIDGVSAEKFEISGYFTGAYLVNNKNFKNKYIFISTLEGTAHYHYFYAYVNKTKGEDFKQKFIFSEDVTVIRYLDKEFFIVYTKNGFSRSMRVLQLKNDYLHDLKEFHYKDERDLEKRDVVNWPLIQKLKLDKLGRDLNRDDIQYAALLNEFDNEISWSEIEKNQIKNPLIRALKYPEQELSMNTEVTWYEMDVGSLKDQIFIYKENFVSSGSLPSYERVVFFNKEGKVISDTTAETWCAANEFAITKLIEGKRYFIMVEKSIETDRGSIGFNISVFEIKKMAELVNVASYNLEQASI